MNQNDAMEIDRIAEILQREIGITSANDELPILATTRITSCTVFYGYEPSLKIGFLCHFDFPFSVKVFPIFFNNLKKYTEKKISVFDCCIIGGNSYLWSKHTRNKLKEEIKKIENDHYINFSIKEEDFLPYSIVETLQIDTRNGKVGKYREGAIIRDSKKEWASHTCRLLSKTTNFYYIGKGLSLLQKSESQMPDEQISVPRQLD